MSSFVFHLEDPDSGAIWEITVTEQPGDGDEPMELLFEIEQTSGDETGDLRGVFFDLQGDTADLEGLTIIDGENVTEWDSEEASISNLGKGVNVNGEVVNEFDKFDFGVAFGTPGGSDDPIQTTSFVLSADTGLTLALVSEQHFAIRLQDSEFGGTALKAPTDGDDELSGTDGNDQIFGEAGDDSLDGAAGDDILDGGEGIDTADYSTDPTGITADLSSGPPGTGTVADGYGSTDTLIDVENVTGTAFDDSITGDDSSNMLVGNDGNDFLDGGGGDDTLLLGRGSDYGKGGGGNDRIIAGEGAGNDVIDGGDGDDDWVDYESIENSSVHIDLTLEDRSSTPVVDVDGTGVTDVGDMLAGAEPTPYAETTLVGLATGAEIDTDVLIDVENAAGGSGDDTFIGNEFDNEFNGRDGTDQVIYTGSVFEYEFVIGSGTSTITDTDLTNGDTGQDTLDNLEQAVFADATIFLDGTNNAPITTAQVVDGFSEDDLLQSTIGGSGQFDTPISLFATDVDSTLTPAGFIGVNNTFNGVEVTDEEAGLSYDPVTGLFVINFGSELYQSLAEGEEATLVHNFEVSDGIDSTPTSVTYNLIGVNDAPDAVTLDLGLLPEDFLLQSTVGGSGPFDTPIDLLATDVDSTLTTESFIPYSLTYQGAAVTFEEAGLSYDPTTGDFEIDFSMDLYQSLAQDEEAALVYEHEVFDGQDSSIASLTWTVVGATDSPLFTGDADAVDFNLITASSYIDGTQYDALGGDDDVALPTDQAAASLAGYDLTQTFKGGTGDDIISGSIVGDVIEGGDDNDQLIGNVGNDELFGQDGDDHFFDGVADITETSGDDLFDGGEGFDSVHYENALTTSGLNYFGGASINDDAEVTGDASIGTDTLVSIEWVDGTGFTDFFFGGEADETLWGHNGNDQFSGGGGNDLLFGGEDDDIFFDGVADITETSGDDLFDGGEGFDSVNYVTNLTTGGINYIGGTGLNGLAIGEASVNGDASIGFDALVSIEWVDGTHFVDTFQGGDADEWLWGQGGSDIIGGGGGNDLLVGDTDDGPAGADTFVFNSGDDQDYIVDFKSVASGVAATELDLIDISGTDVADWTELETLMADAGGDTFIDFGNGDSLNLEGVAFGTLQEGDFIFSSTV